MKKIQRFFFLALAVGLVFVPSFVRAQEFAPELYGVGEIIIDYAFFDDAKASETCNLSRDSVWSTLKAAFANTGVPAFLAAEAKPPTLGVARVTMHPIISSHVDENLGCISWVSLSVENRITAEIQPVSTPRNLTAVYWRTHAKVFSGQSGHMQRVDDMLKEMAEKFIEQYRVDQPVRARR